MPTDDEVLEQVQLRATAIRHRQRLLVAGSAAVLVIGLLGGAVVAGSVRGGRDPVDVAADPVTRSDPATTTTTEVADAEVCVTTDGDLGPGSSGPGGSPTAPTDGSGSGTATSSPSSDSLPARGDPAGPPPVESSIPPDDPPAATLPTVEASTTTCPIRVSIAATYDGASGAVVLAVTALALPLYDAHGYVVWDPADPVREDLGALQRDEAACDALAGGADGSAIGAAQQGDFVLGHTYPSGGDKEVVVQFWAQRCAGPVQQVEVTVTVPL